VELSDTGTIAESIAGGMTEQQKSFLDAVLETVRALKGAFSLVMCDRDTVVGVRDPNGFRPLCLGSLGHGWVLASETAALNTVGARFVREITPGEVVIIEPDSPPRSLFPFPDEGVRSSLCALEFMYLSRPDSYMNGIPVNSARLRMGEILARKALVPADMVIGVPESGIPASEGYSRESGIPWGSGLVKNRYTGRSFINPTQGERERTVRRKLSVLVEQVRGKRLVVVDDSVIRGTVTKHMASLLYGAGALEVHLRIASPPLRWPCFYGVDIGSRTELLARDRSTDQMTEVLGVDTLEFLTPGELREAIGAQVGLCTACMTGKYPTRAGRERAAKLTTGSPATRQYVSSRSLENSDQVPIS
jgi:amidophosphoribosyltransferase